jgi:ACS family hexuronate transporter-like MFS transporter
VGAVTGEASSGRFRWWICGLLFAATTINYIDRQVLGVLAPDLGRIIGWNELQYSYIVTAFQAAYAIGLVCAGAIIDRLGARIGYALAIGVWSLAAIGHSLATTALGFGVARFFLGLGEAGNMPAAVKTVAEWFPRRERALATGSLMPAPAWVLCWLRCLCPSWPSPGDGVQRLSLPPY